MTSNSKPRPTEFRIGRALALVWPPSDGNRFHNVTVHRLYKKDGEQRWEKSQSFGASDIPLVNAVLTLALHHVLQEQGTEGESGETEVSV